MSVSLRYIKASTQSKGNEISSQQINQTHIREGFHFIQIIGECQ